MCLISDYYSGYMYSIKLKAFHEKRKWKWNHFVRDHCHFFLKPTNKSLFFSQWMLFYRDSLFYLAFEDLPFWLWHSIHIRTKFSNFNTFIYHVLNRYTLGNKSERKRIFRDILLKKNINKQLLNNEDCIKV